jgi:hypothetical protein
MARMDGEAVPDPADLALLSAWALLVELRTGVLEIRSAFAERNRQLATRCLVRLLESARRVAPLLCGSPNVAREVAVATFQINNDPDDQDAWCRLERLAAEVEEGIAHATARRNARYS